MWASSKASIPEPHTGIFERLGQIKCTKSLDQIRCIEIGVAIDADLLQCRQMILAVLGKIHQRGCLITVNIVVVIHYQCELLQVDGEDFGYTGW
jgi:hypothetical protein